MVATAAELVIKPLVQVQTVEELILHPGAVKQIEKVAAEVINPTRLVRMMTTAFRTTPRLKDCEPMSFLGAMMEAAQLGLEPNTRLGHAWILPFRTRRQMRGKWQEITEASLVIGYRGFIQLARNSGAVKGLQVGVHYSDDEYWLYRQGTEPVLEHIPGPGRGEREHAYAIVHYLAGGYDMVCWPWQKILDHRDRYSKGYAEAVKRARERKTAVDHAWATNPDAMAIKTMIRQLERFMPKSAGTLRRAMEVDSARADYRAFARDPAASAMIEGSYGEEPEPEIDADTEDDGSPPPEPEQPPAKEKRRKPDVEDAEPATIDKAPQETQQELVSLRAQIVNDLLDAGPARVDQVLELYRDSMERLEREAPELKAEVDQTATTVREGKGNDRDA